MIRYVFYLSRIGRGGYCETQVHIKLCNIRNTSTLKCDQCHILFYS